MLNRAHRAAGWALDERVWIEVAGFVCFGGMRLTAAMGTGLVEVLVVFDAVPVTAPSPATVPEGADNGITPQHNGSRMAADVGAFAVHQ